MTPASAMAVDVPVPARAGRREWMGLAVIALPCILYSMDLTVLHLAVPQLTADLKPTSAQLLWIVDIYGFVLAGFLIPMGTLGDRIGRRRLLMMGAIAFGLASLLAAFSTSAEMLIASRAVLGIAGATLAPSTLSLIRNMFLDPGQRTFAIGVWVTSYSVGGALGPLIGGVLLEFFWWGSVFLIAIPVMVLILTVGRALLPEFRDVRAGRPDILSATLSLAAVLAVIYGFKRFAEGGEPWVGVLSILFGIAVGVAFARRQRVLEHPLIDFALFKRKAFSVSLTTYLLGTLVLFGIYLFTAQYLQLVLGLTPLRAGLWTLPSFLSFVIASLLTPVIARHVRPAYALGGGLVMAAIGFWLLTRMGTSEGLAWFVAASIIYSLGMSPVVTLTTDIVVGSAPPERAGAASALSETSSEFGGALGLAILGSVGIAVYRIAINDAALVGVPAAAIHAAEATLGGAVVAAEQLDSTLRVQLLGAARAAFVVALRTAALLCAGLALATAAMVLLTLRGSPPRVSAE